MSKPAPFYVKSMTAYGRGIFSCSYGVFTVEIQSLNRRHLEVNIQLPKLFSRFDPEIRRLILSSVSRGALNVFVTWHPSSEHGARVIPNLSFAKGLKGAWELLARELGYEEKIPLSLLAREESLFLYEESVEDEKGYQEALITALQRALEAHLTMRLTEGKTLCQDLLERIKQLEASIQQVEAFAHAGSDKYRQKLTSRLKELLGGASEMEERILREIAVFAEKVDITEEIVRFKSHLAQFTQLLEAPLRAPTETKGKTLEFLLQELLREVNTMSSKSAEIKVTTQAVLMKAELEKMREQVQNIE